MITQAEADALIDAACAPLSTHSTALADANGTTLAEDVVAERDSPPFDRVMMDGVAVRLRDGSREFIRQSTQLAGDQAQTLRADAYAIEVMTGTPLPDGTDTVIPVERYTLNGERLRLDDDYQPQMGQFIHRRASDHDQGTIVLRRGQRITAPEIAIIASNGRPDVRVVRQPSIAVIATGDELVLPDRPVAAHQIRLSNAPAITALIQKAGFERVHWQHLPDAPETLQQHLAQLIESHDVIVLSGGVSKGRADYVPAVLETIGVQQRFHRVAQKPGKPLWFGKAESGSLVFGLPGNPVSALCCATRFVLPALVKLGGALPAPVLNLPMASPYRFKPPLALMLPVSIKMTEDGNATLMPQPTNTSGDFSSLAGTDGIATLPAGTTEFDAGDRVAFRPWSGAAF
ncbi:MAG: molybdopterin molybdotransferase MoeA [Pseudomonadota bacterium]